MLGPVNEILHPKNDSPSNLDSFSVIVYVDSFKIVSLNIEQSSFSMLDGSETVSSDVQLANALLARVLS